MYTECIRIIVCVCEHIMSPHPIPFDIYFSWVSPYNHLGLTVHLPQQPSLTDTFKWDCPRRQLDQTTSYEFVSSCVSTHFKFNLICNNSTRLHQHKNFDKDTATVTEMGFTSHTVVVNQRMGNYITITRDGAIIIILPITESVIEYTFIEPNITVFTCTEIKSTLLGSISPPCLRSLELPLYWEKWKKMDSLRSQQVMKPKLCCTKRETKYKKITKRYI